MSAAITPSAAGWPVRAGRVVWALLLPVALVAGYQLWASAAHNPMFPPVPALLAGFRQTWIGPGFTDHVVPSLVNLAAGYLFGFAIGAAIGLLLGRSPTVRRALNPIIAFLLTLPTVALLPLFLLVFGVGQQLQVGVIAFAVACYVLVTTADAVAGIEPVVLDVAAVYRITGARRLRHILLPAIVPQLLSAARVTLSLAVLVMVVSEMVGASRGIGAVTLLAQQSFAYKQMWAGMLLVAILGIGLNALLSAIERRVLRRAGYVVDQGARA